MTSELKVCKRCAAEKPLASFGSHSHTKDGLQSRCKDCINAVSRAYRATPEAKEKMHEYHRRAVVKERVKEKDKARRNSPIGKKQITEAHRRYRESERGRIAAARTKERDVSSGKRIARIAVNNAVRDGRLPKVSTMICCSCGVPAEEFHHHRGYAKESWLDVIPLCRRCHCEADRRQ